MAATVTRLEAELAHAKAALADSHASQEGLHRQKRVLEADLARLHAEVSFCHLGIAVSMVTHPIMHSIIDSFVHKWLQACIESCFHMSYVANLLHDWVWHSCNRNSSKLCDHEPKEQQF